MRSAILIIIACTIALGVNGQGVRARSGNEVGIFLGGSYYTGDLNPTRHFKYTRPAAGILLRRCFNPRFALRATGNYGYIMGKDAGAEYQWRKNRNLDFKSYLGEVGVMLEFNFLPYEIGDPVEVFTPYVFGGFSYFFFNPKTTLNGQTYELHDYGTEGQGLNSKKNYLLAQPSFPFGVGTKFNLFNNFGLSMEWGLRKTWTDYLDDVSSIYEQSSDLKEPVSSKLADRSVNDPFFFRSNISRQRGNSKSNDWYSYAGITLTFRIVPNEIDCKL